MNNERHNPILFSFAGFNSLLGSTAGQAPYAIDAGGSSAFSDIKRIVSTAYIATRNVFRDNALDYFNPAIPEQARYNSTLGINILMNSSTGDPVRGAGDFVVPAEGVTTLCLGTLVTIPSVLAVTWILVLGLRMVTRKLEDMDCPSCGTARQ